MKTKELIAEIISLPVEERALVIDSLLKSLNPPESEIDKKWARVAKIRLEQLDSGEVKPIPGEDVFKKPSHPQPAPQNTRKSGAIPQSKHTRLL